MKAMILAAGLGTRMKPLTDHRPKPLLPLGDCCLIDYHIKALVSAGITEIVVNLHHLGEMIQQYLGDGSRFGAEIVYSDESSQLLETGGGIVKALPLLGDDPFLVVNGDIWIDMDFSLLPRELTGLSHLVLVSNPTHHPEGDFSLEAGKVAVAGDNRLTFSGVGIYRRELFVGYSATPFRLAPLLRKAMKEGQVTGQQHLGLWRDIGTPQRLDEANQLLEELQKETVK